MAFDEGVDVGKGGGHASCKGRVAGRGLQRVDPHELVGDAVQAGHLVAEHGRVAAVPTVREHDDDGPAGHAPHGPLVVEDAQTFAEARAAGPVVHGLGRLAQGEVGVAARQLARNPGQAGAQRECLHLLAPGDRRLHEAQQGAGVRLHRTRYIEQEHEPARPLVRRQVSPPHWLAAGP